MTESQLAHDYTSSERFRAGKLRVKMNANELWHDTDIGRAIMLSESDVGGKRKSRLKKPDQAAAWSGLELTS